jgi:hypothetical protein
MDVICICICLTSFEMIYKLRVEIILFSFPLVKNLSELDLVFQTITITTVLNRLVILLKYNIICHFFLL